MVTIGEVVDASDIDARCKPGVKGKLNALGFWPELEVTEFFLGQTWREWMEMGFTAYEAGGIVTSAAKLKGPPPPQAEQPPKVHSLAEAIDWLDKNCLFRRVVPEVNTYTKNRAAMANEVLTQVVRIVEKKGSPNRKYGKLPSVESASSVGKTHVVGALPKLLADAAKNPTEYHSPAALQEIRAAFGAHGRGRVECIRLDFNGGGDKIQPRDLHLPAGTVLGLRVFARGYLGVRTETLRKSLPADWEQFFAIEDVFPVVCRKLRSMHNLPPEFEPGQSERLFILITLDEFQLIWKALVNVGWSRLAAIDFCKHLQSKLTGLLFVDWAPEGSGAPSSETESSSDTASQASNPEEVSMAAALGAYLVPIIVGTCLSAFDACEQSQLAWHRIQLQALSFQESVELAIHTAVRECRDAWEEHFPGGEGLKDFLERLLTTEEMLSSLEMAGGIPGMVVTAAERLKSVDIALIGRIVTYNDWHHDALQQVAAVWTTEWFKEADSKMQLKKHVDGWERRAVRLLLLLVLSGVPVREDLQLSDDLVLADVLASGFIYVRPEPPGQVSLFLPPVLLQQLCKERSVFMALTSAERDAVKHLNKPQVLLHQQTHGTPFEMMVAAQQVINAACRMALGARQVTLGDLYRPALPEGDNKGVKNSRGGFISAPLMDVEVELKQLTLARETVWLFKPISGPPYRHWGKGKKGPPEASELLQLSNPSEMLPGTPTSLLDPNVVVLMDTVKPETASANRDSPDVDVRMAYSEASSTGEHSSASASGQECFWMLESCKLRTADTTEKSAVVEKLHTKMWPFITAATPAMGCRPVIVFVTTGSLNKESWKIVEAGGASWLVLSGDACLDFIPVLRNRPMLQGKRSQECLCDSSHLFQRLQSRGLRV